jgi:hypothetical protein
LDPGNLIEQEENGSAAPAIVEDLPPVKIKVRLSTTKDVVVTKPLSITAKGLRLAIIEDKTSELTDQCVVMFFYCGKPLQDNTTLAAVDYKETNIIQGMVRKQ